MTNREKFNEMSNIELAKILEQTFLDDKCKFCTYKQEVCSGISCFIGIQMWLSATCANEPENHDIEVIDFIEYQHLGFHLGTAVKYISRAGRKDPAKTIEDLKKAAWYLNRQIERLEREQSGQN